MKNSNLKIFIWTILVLFSFQNLILWQQLKSYCRRVRNFLNFIIFSSAFLQFTCKSHDGKLCLIRKNQIKYGEQGRSSIMMLCNCLQNSNIFLKNCRNPQGSEFNLRIFLKILFALRSKTSVCSKVRRLQHRRASEISKM